MRTLVFASLLAGATCASAATPAAPSNALDTAIDTHLATLPVTPANAKAVDDRCAASLALIDRARTALESREGPATMETDFAAFDTLTFLQIDGYAEMSMVSETHPDKAIRDAAQACVQKTGDAGTAISLSRPIYDRLAAIDTKSLDDKSRFVLTKTLTNYRLAGVDRDAATREKITALQKQITETGLEFARNIRDDKGDMKVRPEALAGVPQDFLDAHKPAADGFVHLTYDYPDVFPIFQFAKDRETRKQVLIGFLNRGHPVNDAVLKRLLEERYALAQTLGLPDYATQVMTDKMIGNPQRAAKFLDDVNAAAKPGADADYAELLAFAKTVDPSIERLEAWDNSYFSNLLQKKKYDVDAAETRKYFTYDKARKGIFQLVHDLFGADIRPWDTPVWDKSVTAWEMYDGDRLVGRFFLDMHPRDGKYNHAQFSPLRVGVEGRYVPMGTMETNFPATGPMDHGDVTTFLHEFGHLVHWMYSGHTRYANQSMINLQWDFIEAPSQLLEEWTFDYDTLKGFASDDKGNPIPQELVRRMNAARHFGEAGTWKRQLAFSAVSLNYYNRKPDFDLSQMYETQFNRYSLLPMPAGTHQYASFGHLDGYSAIYYTYVWSKAIALDLFTRFQADGIRNPETAMRYRRMVLEPGGSEDANVLISDFLGRPLSQDAFRTYLQAK
ncbi:MAG: Zn-dependent oligopeptidase [Lysobacter sp.]|nr:Zn-dependent oligopeptidase [Lysobacter sp.]